MAKADLLSILYSKEKSPLEFKFDSMWIPSMYNFLTPQDIQELHYLASSARFSSKIDFKYKEIDRIMTNRGFKKFHCGTNRIVYSYLEDQSFLVKIALDKVGLSDNPAEYKNQFLLKPFVTKVFEVSPCGTVATVERVEPITSREEFLSLGEDIFDLMNECIIGKYVLEDVGTKYFMNWGLRKGFGAVLLDYTYVYELDGNKLFCNKLVPETGQLCNGVIDYDAGFNNLICSKCGKRYLAKELEQSVKDKLIILKDEGEIDMKISLKRGNQTVATFFTNNETETIVRKKKRNFEPELKVSLSRGTNTIGDNVNIPCVNDYNPEESLIKVSLVRGNNKPQRRDDYKNEFNKGSKTEKRETRSVELNLDTTQVEESKLLEKTKDYFMEKLNLDEDNENKISEVSSNIEKPVRIEQEQIKEYKPEEIKEAIDNIIEEVASKEQPIYTRDAKVEIKSSFLADEEKDLISKFGLSEEDFEEPKEEDKKDEKEEKDLASKYFEEYDQYETENFERIKPKKKSVMEMY